MNDLPRDEPRHFDSDAAGFLDEATHIVCGSRQITHGDKERSFQTIATLWNAYLARRAITPTDVAVMMVLLKIARCGQGTHTRDHFVDMAGYAALAGELSGKTDGPTD